VPRDLRASVATGSRNYQHQELLDALQSRDEAKVLSVLERHIRTYLVIDAG